MNKWLTGFLTITMTIPSLTWAQQPLSPTPHPPLPVVVQQAQITRLIERAERHFQLGKAAYDAGDFTTARREFNQAVDTILDARIDIRSSQRLHSYFITLIEKINALEVEALARGHLVDAQRYEPALHDELVELTLDETREEASEEANITPTLDFAFELTPQIKQFIYYFTHTKRGRATMEKGLKRAGKYLAIVRRIFQEERVPLDLVWLAQAESNWRPLARSRAGALGIWQFVRFTGRKYGLRQNAWIDERMSIEQATRAAARYLRFLYDRYLDWALAMAAYNCGEGRVDRAIAACGYADFWYMHKHRLLPRQTRNYVPIILAIIIIAKNPEKYGFTNIDPDPPLQYETVTVRSAIDLRLVAEIANTPYEIIEELNPELKRGITPPDMEYTLRLPSGTAQQFVALLERIPEDRRDYWRVVRVKPGQSLQALAAQYELSVDRLAQVNELPPDVVPEPGTAVILPLDEPRPFRHGLIYETRLGRRSVRRIMVTVRPGDTLSRIASRYGTSVREIARLNKINPNGILRVGQKLLVYAPVTRRGNQRVSRSSFYSVRRGDTLYSIARRHGLSVSTLKMWNRLRSNKIYPGQRLRVRPPRTAPAPTKGGTYIVQPGDTLSEIAQRYGVSIADLRRWNSLRSSRIYAGQRLVVRPKTSPKRRGKKIVHRVKRGETLSSIARRYGVSVARIKSWNGLRSNRILSGQRLVIYRRR